MDSKNLFLVALMLFNLISGSKMAYGLKGKRLFVFGDSYVDTGNTNKLTSESWKQPYGITFPGKPSGRWSDGRVWSDYIAQHLGLESPVPFELRAQKKNWKNGMNFAYGGSGVFNTFYGYPNMTIQIDNFQRLIRRRTYTTSDLLSSVALVAVSGNDITQYFVDKGGNVTEQEWNEFQKTIVNQTIINIKRITKLGVNVVAVDALQPLGCLPSLSSEFSNNSCREFSNNLSIYQNNLLRNEMNTLASQNRKTKFYYLDLYGSWITVLNQTNFTPWKPCCDGTNGNSTCGKVDANGTLLYSVCANPNTTFYWDFQHPSQRGWRELYLYMRTKFNPLS